MGAPGRKRKARENRTCHALLSMHIRLTINCPGSYLPDFGLLFLHCSMVHGGEAAHITSLFLFIHLLTNILHHGYNLHPLPSIHCFYLYSSSVPPTLVFPFPFALPGSTVSGILMTPTTQLVHPVKCCVRCPLPVSGLYCSQANPVSVQEL